MRADDASFAFELAISELGRQTGVSLSAGEVAALTSHARAVYAANPILHLTSILEPREFVARHIGESLMGAALLPATLAGVLLDLGSGNGYPGIPIAVSRPRLMPVLVESSARKAAFLREALLAAGLSGGRVLHRRVARAAELEDLEAIAVLVTRAAGGWERIVPKLATRIERRGHLLLWAGPDAQSVLARPVWQRFRSVEARRIPGRDHSFIYHLINDNN